jgi:Methyltransferase FkbM domain
VPSVPLDELAARHGIAAIRLMKVDCEGAEARVVRGAATLLARRAVAFLALEYHRAVLPGAEVAATDAWLRAQGYAAVLCRQTLVYHLAGGEPALAALGEVEVVPPLGG